MFGKPKAATWEEYSEFYKDLTRHITVSEFDRKQLSQIFCKEQDFSKLNGAKDRKINFLSSYYIQTHQGNFFVICQIVALFLYFLLQ